MTISKKTPNPEKFQRGVEKLKDVCKQLDSLNIILDDAIAQLEAEKHHSPSYLRRLKRAKHLLDSQLRGI